MPIKPEPAKLHGKMVLSWIKTSSSRLKTNLSKLNILNLIGMVIEYTTKGSSNLILVGKHAFTDESWKIWITLMSSTCLFRKENLQILVAAF